MKLKILAAVILFLVCIQFVNTNTNVSEDTEAAIWSKYATSDAVKNKLKDACFNCHSNKSEYPWYSHIQPVSYWLSRHINEGKEHLNFSDFTTLSIARQYHKLEETYEMIEEGEMPLKSYTYFGLHPEARLTPEDKKLIMDWAQTIMQTLKANSPAESFALEEKD
jgi:hypothetical protein